MIATVTFVQRGCSGEGRHDADGDPPLRDAHVAGRAGPEAALSAGLAMIRRGIVALADATTRAVPDSALRAVPDSALRAAIAELTALQASLEAARLAFLRDLDTRPEAVRGAPAGRAAATFLTQALRVSGGQAGRDVAAARAIDPDGGGLTELGAALAEGAVSRAHVDEAVRALDRIPTTLLSRVDEQGLRGVTRIDTFMTEQSRRFPPAGIRRLARHLLAVLDPDGSERIDPQAYQRRQLTCATDDTGMLVGTYQLDPAGGAVVKAALDAFGRPAPAGAGETVDGERILVRDTRTRAQRYADALVAIARVALGAAAPPADADPERSPGATGRAGTEGLAHILILAGADQIAAVRSGRGSAAPGLAECTSAGPIGSAVLAQFACDAVLQRVLVAPSGAVLELGRTTRTVSAAQRRALIARDRGCVIPNCTAPIAACDAHHVRYWSSGGRTHVGNLALVCATHHSAVHARVWGLRLIDGRAWAIPPPWLDPLRRPMRNLVHEAVEDARTVARHLRAEPG